MNSKKFKKYRYEKDNLSFEIEEDLVGWYLFVYRDQNSHKAFEDYLLDSMEAAFFEAKKNLIFLEMGGKKFQLETEKF